MQNYTGFPRTIGTFEKKKITLHQNKKDGSLFISYNKKTYNAPKENLSVKEAIEIINSDGKVPLLQLKSGVKIYSICQGKENKYINVHNTKTNKKYNVALPENEKINELTTIRINEIITTAFNKK
jgi:hypothetical protein